MRTLLLFFVATFALNAQAVQVDFERNTSLPLVFINIVSKTGYAADPGTQAGVTNFMGEMLLRGTKLRSKELIDQELDLIGARLEVEARAESTIFRGAVLSSQLDRFLMLLKEILTEPSFPEKEIVKLKAEVGSALLEEKSHDARLGSRLFTRFLFGSHPYGKPPIGTISSIQKLTRAQVIEQYRKLMQDSLLLVVGTGDAENARINTWAQELAKARPDSSDLPSLMKAFQIPPPPTYAKRRLLLIDKPDRNQTQVYEGQTGILMTDPDYYALTVANQAFGGGGSMGSTLMKELRIKTGWTYGANSAFRVGTQPRSWSMYFFPAAKDTPKAFARSLELIQDAAKSGITAEEFEQAKSSLINGAGFEYDTPKKRVENKLLEKTLGLPDGFVQREASEIQKVQLADSNQALERFLKPGALTLTVLGIAKDLKEPLAKAAGIDPAQVEVVPYTVEDLPTELR